MFLLILLMSLTLSACGQKGPLYRAPAMKDNKTQVNDTNNQTSTNDQANDSNSHLDSAQEH